MFNEGTIVRSPNCARPASKPNPQASCHSIGSVLHYIHMVPPDALSPPPSIPAAIDQCLACCGTSDAPSSACPGILCLPCRSTYACRATTQGAISGSLRCSLCVHDLPADCGGHATHQGGYQPYYAGYQQPDYHGYYHSGLGVAGTALAGAAVGAAIGAAAGPRTTTVIHQPTYHHGNVPIGQHVGGYHHGNVPMGRPVGGGSFRRFHLEAELLADPIPAAVPATLGVLALMLALLVALVMQIVRRRRRLSQPLML